MVSCPDSVQFLENDLHHLRPNSSMFAEEDQRTLQKLQKRLAAQQQSPVSSTSQEKEGSPTETPQRRNCTRAGENALQCSNDTNEAFTQRSLPSKSELEHSSESPHQRDYLNGSHVDASRDESVTEEPRKFDLNDAVKDKEKVLLQTPEAFFVGTPERFSHNQSWVQSGIETIDTCKRLDLQDSPQQQRGEVASMEGFPAVNLASSPHRCVSLAADDDGPLPSPANDLLEECSFLSPNDLGVEDRSPSGVSGSSECASCRQGSSPSGDLTTDLGTTSTSPVPKSDRSSNSPSSPPRLADLHFERHTVSLRDFERLNGSLIRNGFREIPHRVDDKTRLDTEQTRSPKLCIEGLGLWELFADVIRGFEERGKRLQDSLHRTLSEERQQRDTRIQGLLRQNARLNEELQSLREEVGRRNLDGAKSFCDARTAAGTSRTASRNKDLDKELHEASLRMKAAEAAARSRERELDRLKGRFEQLLETDQRRQTMAKEAISKLSNKRSTVISNKDAPFLEVVRALQSQNENLTMESKVLTKQVHSLTFELEAAETRARKLEAAQQLQPPSVAESSGVPGLTCSDLAEQHAMQRQLKEVVAQEKALRTELQEQLLQQQVSHETASTRLSATLHAARSELAEALRERQEAERAPTPGERKWKREALRARDELAEVRRVWRTTDSREAMRRDKDLSALGLDAYRLQETVQKGDLVRLLLDICQALRVGNLAQLVPTVQSLDSALAALPELESFANSAFTMLSEVDGNDKTLRPEEALEILRHICQEVEELRTRKPPKQLASPRESQHDVEPNSNLTMMEHWVDHGQEGAPSAGEMRWRREAFRARNELADARRNWRASDSRELMKRDKELKILGLNAEELKESITKDDLVTFMIDVCRALHVGDVTEAVPKLRGLEDAIAKLPDMEAFSLESRALIKEMGQDTGDLGPAEALERLRQLQRELSNLRSNIESGERGGAAVLHNNFDMVTKCHLSTPGTVQGAQFNTMPSGVSDHKSACNANEVSELRISDAVLRGVVAQLHASSIHDVPQRVSGLLRLCDERMAAQRIVEALQRLLNVAHVAEILPALKESLDLPTLMKRRHREVQS